MVAFFFAIGLYTSITPMYTYYVPHTEYENKSIFTLFLLSSKTFCFYSLKQSSVSQYMRYL